MPDGGWIWILGLGASLLSVVMGARIRYFQGYGLLPGYNTASPEEQSRYDVKGLGDHIGNGFITLGVLLLLGMGASLFGFAIWTRVFIGLFLGTVFIMVVGTRKFLPGNHYPPGEAPPAEHRFLRRITSEKLFRAMERGTRNWLIECPCGHVRDYWDTGGIRYKAAGEPRQLYACPVCEKGRWHKVRRKREGELGGPGNPPPAESLRSAT